MKFDLWCSRCADTTSVDATAFGAPITNPKRSASVLRAIASRAGIVLQEADDVDCAAAVLAADIWSRLTGVAHLAGGERGGKEAETAARILARAAGYGCVTQDLPLGYAMGPGNELVLHLLDGYQDWTAAYLGDNASAALARAGFDLLAGGDELSSAGTTLILAADDL